MLKIDNLHPEYITDEQGLKRSVVLPISDFQALMEDVEDLVAIVERRDEPTISHEQLLNELRKDGFV